MKSLPPIPPIEGDISRADLSVLLEQFDLQRHGGEAMAFVPVGRECVNAAYVQSVGDPEEH